MSEPHVAVVELGYLVKAARKLKLSVRSDKIKYLALCYIFFYRVIVKNEPFKFVEGFSRIMLKFGLTEFFMMNGILSEEMRKKYFDINQHNRVIQRLEPDFSPSKIQKQNPGKTFYCYLFYLFCFDCCCYLLLFSQNLI